MNVPENAQGVLGLVWEVGHVVEEVAEAARAGAGAMEEDTEDHYAATTDVGSESGSDSEVDDATGVLRRALKAGGGRPANSEGGQDGRTMSDDALTIALGMPWSLWCTNGWAMVGVKKKEVGRRIVALTTPT
ncbi:hypothetical protein B0H11DRAFT_2282193 [Mycena galericulata]|nr:hypothetical protein B0H11DRAFT_2282193 [Mycena galericulata]